MFILSIPKLILFFSEPIIKHIVILGFSLLFLSSIGHAATYKYDSLNRLVRAEYNNNKVFTYNYDDGGNLLSIDFSGGNYTALSQWQEAQGGNCHWYGVVPANTTWSEANTQANALTHQGVQGHLATLTSAEENTFAKNLADTAISGRYLIGAYQKHKNSEPNGGWAWLNDEPWGYTSWFVTEPNNTPDNEDQVEIHSTHGLWNDIPGESDYARSATGYIVEFGTGCGDSNTPNNPATLTLPETDDHGSYNLTWSVVSNTTVTHYELQEAQHDDFSDATRLYAGLSTSHAITGKPAGTYYYRVRACNGSFCGAWQTTPQGLPVTGVCIDQITPAYNPETGEEKEFASPCDVPDGWVTGQAPDFDGDGKNDIVDEDDDNDGMSDIWEITNGLNSKDATDAESDLDGDGRSNLDEFIAGTDPTDSTDYATLTISLNQAKTLDNEDVELSTSIYLDNVEVNEFKVSFEYGSTPSLGSISDNVNSAEIVSLLLTGNAENQSFQSMVTVSGLERDKTIYYRPKLVLNGKTYLGTISKLVVAGACSYGSWEPLISASGDYEDSISRFVYGNGVLVSASPHLLRYSLDNGINWDIGLIEYASYFDVVWADNAFFAIGRRGVYKSELGDTWQFIHEYSNTDVPNRISWNGKQLLTIGKNGKILISTDGTDWSEYYVGEGDFLSDIIWVNNQYAVVSREGNLFTSPTGRTWTHDGFIGFFGNVASVNITGNEKGLIAHDSTGDDNRIFSKLHSETNWTASSRTYDASMYLWDGHQYFGASDSAKSTISRDGLVWLDKPALSGRTILFDNEYVYVGGAQGSIERSRCGAPSPVEISVEVENTVTEAGSPFGFTAKIIATGTNIPSTIAIEVPDCETYGGLFPQTTQYDKTNNRWTSTCNIQNTGNYNGVVRDLLTDKVLAHFQFELKYAVPVVSGFISEPAIIHVGDDVLFTFTGEHLRPYSDMSLDGFENCAYTVGSYAPPPPGSNVTEIKYQCHAVSAGSKQGVINFSEELTPDIVKLR